MSEHYTFRVAWGDCDPAQIVFYPNFIAQMNEAAHAFLEARGYSIRIMRERMGAQGVPMVSLKCDFRGPMRVGDVGEIETRVVSLGRSSLKLSHRVTCAGALVVEAEETRVFSGLKEDGTLAGLPIPDAMRAALSSENGA